MCVIEALFQGVWNCDVVPVVMLEEYLKLYLIKLRQRLRQVVLLTLAGSPIPPFHLPSDILQEIERSTSHLPF